MFALNLNNTKGEYMKLQNLTVIFIIIIIPIILLVSLYITTGLKTLKYQSLYDTGLLTATHDAIFAFEQNTSNNEYSNNPEIKRDILKSSIKMFEKSLANTCGISSYNVEEIEEYIPAIVFGMYDGFYMYAPSKELVDDNKYEYKHNLKNYVYYSETLDDGTVIRYSLDNYVVVTGIFKDENGNDVYQTKGGYLAVGSSNDGKTYQGVTIVEETGLGEHSKDGINYYKESHEFTNWFLNTAKIGEKADYLKIGEEVNGYVNDPEDDNSAFVQHKRSIMKSKIEGVLNSSITAYSNRIWDKVYKMPKLSEEDWQKIYSNISMITFFQGKNIGLTKYNGYCVLNSTNSREYVNPNLMYFIEDDYYHDIRCTQLSTQASGYRIGKYEKIKVEQIDENGVTKVDDNGNVLYKYVYEHNKLACYDCINGPLQNNVSLYDYVRTTATDTIKTSYFTSLGRERYNGSKPISYIPTYNENESEDENVQYTVTYYDTIPEDKIYRQDKHDEGSEIKPSDVLIAKAGYNFIGWNTDKNARGPIAEPIKVDSNKILYAIWEEVSEVKISYYYDSMLIEQKDIEKSDEYTIEEISSKIDSRGYIFVGWEFEGTIYPENSSINIKNKTEVNLYAKYIELSISAYESDNTALFENQYTNYTKHTNSDSVKVNITARDKTGDEDVELKISGIDINDIEVNNEFEKIVTEEKKYEIYITPTMQTITKESIKITIVIDRTLPVLEKSEFRRDIAYYNWKGNPVYDATGIGILYVKISDEGGISTVQVYHTETRNGIRKPYPYLMEKNNAIGATQEYNYRSSNVTNKKLFRQFITKIVITDKAGNSKEYPLSF